MLLGFLITFLVLFETVSARATPGGKCPGRCTESIPRRWSVKFNDKQVFQLEGYVHNKRRPGYISLWREGSLLFRIEIRPMRRQIATTVFQDGAFQRVAKNNRAARPASYTNLRLVRSKGKLKIFYNDKFWTEMDRFHRQVTRIAWYGFIEVRYAKGALSDYQCLDSNSLCGITSNMVGVPPDYCPSRPGNRIVGGKNALAGAHPWQVAIRDKVIAYSRHPHKCGGILIDSCWVVSAAHCFASLYPERNFIVRVGDYSNDEGSTKQFRNYENSQDINIDKVIRHKDYDVHPSTMNDIALLKLEGSPGNCAILGNFVKPACLPTAAINFPPKTSCVISGWGATESDQAIEDYPVCLQKARVKLLEKKSCREYYPNLGAGERIHDHMVCAKGEKEPNKTTADACQGDSGGPLVCATGGINYAWGITSWGEGCGDKPGVFTKVAEFLDWMENRFIEACDADLFPTRNA